MPEILTVVSHVFRIYNISQIGQKVSDYGWLEIERK